MHPSIEALLDARADEVENDIRLAESALAIARASVLSIEDQLNRSLSEAIAINDRRLTALTSIRNSSAAIHVGGQPLSPPYVVEAIGDVRTLQANLVNNARGARFFSLAQTLGFQVTRDNVDRLRLPGSRPQTLRYAHAVTASDAKAAGGGDRP